MIDRLLESGFLWLLGVGAVTLLGLLLTCWGLWGDRSKGRARCPECWYDMRGALPQLVCPECGYVAQRERRLHKTRRRWGRIIIGAVAVLLLVYSLDVVGGWWREQWVVRKYGIGSVGAGQEIEIGPAWLVRLLPDGLPRFFNRIDVLNGIDDPAQLAACQRLPYLTYVEAIGESITNADLMHLQGLSKLRTLTLWRTPVTDAGLIHLQGLSNLENLNLWETQVTGAGLVHLHGLSKLVTLHLHGSPVKDAELVHLQGLSFLEELNLNSTDVTDAGLEHLKGMPHLWRLWLGGTQVTDAGLVHLQGLTNLFGLVLWETQVTDAGLAHLS